MNLRILVIINYHLVKPFIALITLIIICQLSHAQERKLDAIADSITREGTRLYQLESASWYGTDVFEAKCKSKMPRVGGYLSYNSGYDLKNIFFSKDVEPVVLGTMSFPYENVSAASCKIDTTERKLNATELDLYQMRKAAMSMIIANKDTLFRFYKNMGTNPVPLITNGQRKVYVLTGPQESGLMVFGNDYLINFDDHNQISKARALHKNLIPIRFGKPDSTGVKDVAGVHTHLPTSGDYITATDICTLMLYEKFTTWKSYYVISDNNVSIWDCKTDHLTIITREAWDKIRKDQQERHPAKQQ